MRYVKLFLNSRFRCLVIYLDNDSEKWILKSQRSDWWQRWYIPDKVTVTIPVVGISDRSPLHSWIVWHPWKTLKSKPTQAFCPWGSLYNRAKQCISSWSHGQVDETKTNTLQNENIMCLYKSVSLWSIWGKRVYEASYNKGEIIKGIQTEEAQP